MDKRKLFEDLKDKLEMGSRTCFGYPENQKFDYSSLLPFFKYHINNFGDPFLLTHYQCESKYIEQECINWFARLYQIEEPWGYLTSGGTEANFYGIYLGRELLPDATFYYSEDSNYSVAKAAHFLRVPCQVIKSQPNGEIDYQDLEQTLLQKKPANVIFNINIGTTFTGAFDNIARIVEILEKYNTKYYLHCDAALSGMILPFIESAPRLNFLDFPIDSLMITGHKFFGSPIPYGILLTRKEYVANVGNFVDYIHSRDTTFLSSRCGHAALLLWYAICNREKTFHEEAAENMKKSLYLFDQLKKLDYEPMLNDYSNTVVFKKPTQAVCRKWQLATQKELAHIVVMQHVTRELIDEFINDLDNT